MTASGWTLDQLQAAIDRANNIYAKDGGPGIEIRIFSVLAKRSHRGGQTLRFTLGYQRSTRRLKNGGYPPGVGYKSWDVPQYTKDIIPWADVCSNNPGEHTGGKRISYITRKRGSGSLCWHAFGHVFAELFDLNENGKLITAMNTYDGYDDFRRKASQGRGSTYSASECDCPDYNLESFFK